MEESDVSGSAGDRIQRFPLLFLLVGILLVSLTTGAAALPSPTSAEGEPPAKTRAHVTGTTEIAPGTVDLTVWSPALGREANVRLLLPDGWSGDGQRHAKKRWPVLYLLHGCCDGYDSWTRETDVEQIEALDDVLVVMPEAGAAGWYSNWWNHGRYGSPAWETFHLQELRTLLERDWGAGHRRAVAGLSMGGLGAMKYAATHRGMFRAAASYSGVLHTRRAVDTPQWLMRFVANYGFDPLRLWGDPVEQERIWRANNPYDLAGRLHGVDLFVASGNGRPGALDSPSAVYSDLEHRVGEQAREFVERLRGQHIRVQTDFYGAGTHAWPYWERELHRSLPLLLNALGVN
jgi:diacylglycerol O-acyltransferase/trehalose O-mycolyltransferase